MFDTLYCQRVVSLGSPPAARQGGLHLQVFLFCLSRTGEEEGVHCMFSFSRLGRTGVATVMTDFPKQLSEKCCVTTVQF